MGKARRTGVLAILIALFQITAAPALVRFDFEQNYFNEPGFPVLDHFVVEVNSVFHLFYLRGDPAINIGHATTTDFIHWNLEPPVLSPGTWDPVAIWAPHLIERDGVWHMFFTGIAATLSQQTGLAFSTDLYDWTDHGSPVYHPDPSWAEWSPSFFTHGRDPHVLEYNGKYYQYVTAKTLSNEGAVALAESRNLINWNDIGPAYVHDSWHVLESVFVFEHGTKWHMMFTEQAVGGTSDMTSDSPISGWDFATRRIIDLGHGPQVTPTSSGHEIFSRHAIYNNRQGTQLYCLRFDTLSWVGDIPVPTKPWPLAANWEIIFGDAFTRQPVFGNNLFARGESVNTNHEGDSWVGTYEFYTGPIGKGSVGQFLGDGTTGIIRSRPFVITGNSMNLLVGGGDFPNECYVALVDTSSGSVLHKETGLNTDGMDRRYWDLVSHIGKTVYIEIADLSTGVFGHINVDDIVESSDFLEDPDDGNGTVKDRPSQENVGTANLPAAALFQNSPNPFNPTTVISFELLKPGHVRMDIFNVSGVRVRTVVDGHRDMGHHQVEWDGIDNHGADVTSGVYFYRLTLDGLPIATRKMTLLK